MRIWYEQLPWPLQGDIEYFIDDYEEAVLFLDCDLMKAICKREGLDHEYILEQALTITKANI